MQCGNRDSGRTTSDHLWHRACGIRAFHDAAPALLIQDELHLLSEELGTFDSHYETAAMQFAKSTGAKPWKIIAATATIEEYAQHAWQLYLRKARQFPGPGSAAYDSFYYQQNRDRLGRLFVGVLGVGRKHTPSVTRTLTMFYLELQSARDWAKADLAAASSEYVGRALTANEFRRLVFLYELALTYVLTRKGSDQVTTHFDRVLLMLDGDNAGRLGTTTSVNALASRVVVTAIELGDSVQPDQRAARSAIRYPDPSSRRAVTGFAGARRH